jgi:Neprosin
MTIKYQLYWNNWWFACQGRWMGYYPASLFMGNQSVFSTLVDHADHIGFWGEVFDSDDIDGRTSTDMGSGYFAEVGWPWSGYMHNLRAQAMLGGSMADYDGSAELSSPIPISRATSTAVLVGQLCLRRWTRSRLRSLRQGLGESQWQLPDA